MGITFKKSPIIKVGDRLKSSHVSDQAEAMNSRLRSGCAEPWRIVYYFASLFRQIRNSDGDLIPPNLEFFKFYQHINPVDATWPDAAPGDPAGVNVASVLGGYIYGVDPSLKSESEVLDAVPLVIPGSLAQPAKPHEHWLLAKFQRGTVDVGAGVSAAPMLDAGDQFWKNYQGPTSPHGNAFGAYLAGPAEQSPCADGSVPLSHFLTNLKTAAVHYFTDTCDGVGESGSNVSFVFETEKLIIAVKINGSVEVFDKLDWVQGPYTTETKLRKTSSRALDRVLGMFASEHRGTSQQRSDSQGKLVNAFDFQKFFTRQYHLAPARGGEVGDSINAIYPMFTESLVTSLPAGHLLQINGGTGTTPQSGFVFSSCLVVYAGAPSQHLNLEFFVHGVSSGTVNLVSDQAGVAEIIHTFTTPVVAGSVFQIQIVTALASVGGGLLTVEVAELLDYKPRLFDAYALLRLAGINGSGVVDGGGDRETSAHEISHNYFQNANVTNVYGALIVPDPPAAINQSAIFETARNLSKVVRVIPRQQLVGYEVAGGKSILYFKRFARGNSFADSFAGIIGATSTAPKQGWTNEWLMGVDFKASSAIGNNTSEFRPDVYADHFSLNNRCLFYADEMKSGFNPRLSTHVAFSSVTVNGNLLAEAPSGYNYAKKDFAGGGNVNSKTCGALDAACISERLNFYKSCRIYEPWPEIESAVVLIESGEEIVKITFKQRLRSTFGEAGGAPPTIDRDLDSFDSKDVDDLWDEPFRTDENGIREYLFNQKSGRNCNAFSDQPGNRAINYSGAGLEGVFGSCYPDFLFVKLIEKPFNDGNDAQDSHDSPVDFSKEVQKEIYLRAICEGFVDGKTSAELNCGSGAEFNGLYCFTYETLNVQAHGRAWPTLLSSGDRSEFPRGLWPMPNTRMRAERFNQYSNAINLLDRIPLMMPMTIEARTTQRNGTFELTGVSWPNAEDPCNTPDISSIRALQSPVGSVTLTDDEPSAWAEINVGDANSLSSTSALRKDVCGDEGKWVQHYDSLRLEVRSKPEIDDQQFALPPALMEMVDGFQTSMLANVYRNETYYLKRSVSVFDDAFECGTSRFFAGATGYNFDFKGQEATECLVIGGGKKFEPFDYYEPRGDSFVQGDGGLAGACSGGWQSNLYIKILGGNSDTFLQFPVV